MGTADTLPLKLLLLVCVVNHIQGEWAASAPEHRPIWRREGSRKAASPLASGADQRGLLVVEKTAPFCGITPEPSGGRYRRTPLASMPSDGPRPRGGEAAAGGVTVFVVTSASVWLLLSGERRQPLL